MRLLFVFLTSLAAVIPTYPVSATRDSSIVPQSPVAARPKKVGSIMIPKIKVTAPIFIGVSDAVFNRGVGQWPGTPRAGKNGNLVLGAHRTSASAPFRNIHKLKSGDIISITANKKTYRYKVTGHSIVKPTSVWITKQTSSPTLTLFSCHPIGRISQRFVIRAVLVA